MVKNGRSKPEQGAEFVLLDESLVKDFKDQTLATSQDRLDYIEKLQKSNKKAILGTLVTDADGNAAMLLKDFTKDTGFIVLQISDHRSTRRCGRYTDNQRKRRSNIHSAGDRCLYPASDLRRSET